jgi:hypothetical protein
MLGKVGKNMKRSACKIQNRLIWPDNGKDNDQNFKNMVACLPDLSFELGGQKLTLVIYINRHGSSFLIF